ncbi:MAG: helix-turn-helix domain-containing protein [Actinomycetota bacterium]
MSSARPTDLIQSVSRALRILQEVGDSREGLNVEQIAHRCDIALPTTCQLVRTLAYEGYLARRSNGVYGLGLEIASRFRDLVASMHRPPQIHEVLRQMAEVTGHTASFAQIADGHVVLTDSVPTRPGARPDGTPQPAPAPRPAPTTPGTGTPIPGAS